jgi:antirestriction protein ArdC
MKRDIYQSITDQIVSELAKGVRPWQKPWSAGHMDGRVVLPLRHNGIAYRGVNIITLWMASLAKGYSAPVWMTFKQAIDLGGGVRKGEKEGEPQCLRRHHHPHPDRQRERRGVRPRNPLHERLHGLQCGADRRLCACDPPRM